MFDMLDGNIYNSANIHATELVQCQKIGQLFGNLVLTDFELKILNILRPRVAGEERFLVRRKSEFLFISSYPFSR